MEGGLLISDSGWRTVTFLQWAQVVRWHVICLRGVVGHMVMTLSMLSFTTDCTRSTQERSSAWSGRCWHIVEWLLMSLSNRYSWNDSSIALMRRNAVGHVLTPRIRNLLLVSKCLESWLWLLDTASIIESITLIVTIAWAVRVASIGDALGLYCLLFLSDVLWWAWFG